MKKFVYVFLLVFPILFSGCSQEDIQVVRIKDVTYNEIDVINRKVKLDIVATIHNPNFFSVRLTDADMVLRLQDRVIGNVTQVSQIEIDGRAEKDYTISIAIEMRDLLSNVMSLYRIFTNDPSNLNLSGTVHVKSFLYSKTFQVERLSFQ